MARTFTQATALLAALAALTLATTPAIQLTIGLPLCLAALILWALRPFDALTRH
jgi:hypothetical protein